jgi:hypothetical protein
MNCIDVALRCGRRKGTAAYRRPAAQMAEQCRAVIVGIQPIRSTAFDQSRSGTSPFYDYFACSRTSHYLCPGTSAEGTPGRIHRAAQQLVALSNRGHRKAKSPNERTGVWLTAIDILAHIVPVDSEQSAAIHASSDSEQPDSELRQCAQRRKNVARRGRGRSSIRPQRPQPSRDSAVRAKPRTEGPCCC